MRVAHFCFALDAQMGGVPRGVFLLASHLQNHGIQNLIISFGNTQKQLARNSIEIENLIKNKVECIFSVAKFQNNYGIGSIKGIKHKLLNLAEPDLLVLHQVYSFSTIIGYWYAKTKGIPYVVMPHGSLTNYHEADSTVIKTFAKWLIISRILHNARSILVTSQLEKSDLISSLRIKSLSIGYGTERQNSLNGLATELNNSIENTRIIFIGRFDKKKNLDLIFKAMPQILKIFPNLILDIAGNGTKKEVRRVEHIIATLGIGRNVEMHGWIGSEQIQELLANSRLLILPSENENFAIVVAEALSAGIPCVVSKNVGLAEIIQKNNAGEVIGELNPNSIAEGILKVLLGDRQKLRSAAFRSAEISLDWSDIANRWKALIASLS